MRDIWLLLVVLGVAVGAGMWKSGPAPAAKAEMPAARGAMGDMGAMGMPPADGMAATKMGEGAGACPMGGASADGEGMTKAEGDACCPTDGEAAAADHDCSEDHAASKATAGELTPDQMTAGVCPMGGPAAATDEAKPEPAKEAVEAK